MNDEVGRLRCLHELALLGTPPEPEYDDLVRLAALLCGTACAALTLVDEHATWTKASFGQALSAAPRRASFAGHAIETDGLFVVEDATRDGRFAGSPLVAGAPHVVFYASMPLSLPGGARVGDLAVFDSAPRRLDEPASGLLKTLARQAGCLLERVLERRRHEQARQRLADVQSLSHLASWELDARTGRRQWSGEVARIFGTELAPSTPFESFLRVVHPDDRNLSRQAEELARVEGAPIDLHVRIVRPDGSIRHVHERAARLQGPAPRDDRIVGAVQDVTQEHEATRALLERTLELEVAGEQLRLACQMGHLGSWEFDVRRQTLHGDAEYLRILGFQPQEAPTAAQVVSLFVPEDQKTIAEAFGRCCRDGTPYDLVLKFSSRQGDVLWTRSIGKSARDGTGAVVRVYGIFQDITEHIEAVVAAHRVGRQLETTLERMSDGFYLLDRDWRFQYFNAAAERLLGRSRSELLGRTVWETFPAVVGSELERVYLQASGSGHTARLAYQYPPQQRWYEVTAYPSDEGLAVYFRDNTEQHVQVQRWRLLAESMPIVVWTAREDGVLDYASSLLARYAGVPIEQLIPDGWFTLVHAEDQARVAELWTQARHTRRPLEVEYRLRRADGVYRWHLVRASPVQIDAAGTIAWYGSSVDIDDNKRLEQEASALARRLTATMESITDGIFSLDGRWCFSYVNRQAEVYLGRTREELLGRNVWEAFPDASGSRFQHMYEQCQASGTVARFEEHYEPLGKLFEVTAYPSDGGITVYFRDVSERQQAEQDRAAREAAEQASEAKSRFLARISHELRTPLNAILGFTQLMEIDTEAPLRGHQADRLHKVHAASRHLLAMINEILDLASIESGNTPLSLEPAALHAVARSSFDGIEPQAGAAGVRLIDGIGPEAPAVVADSLRLHQVLLNLLSNAVKYNHRGGWVRLSARARGDRVLIDVEDTGRGLSDEQLEHLFQPFNRLGAERTDIEGAGLGLVIAKGLAQLMHGDLHAARRDEGGSIFTLELPLANLAQDSGLRAAVADGGAGPAPQDNAAGVATVLYIEDDPVNALLVRHIMDLRPHCLLHEAADGEIGLALARQLQPDLVLTDMNLPGMTGYDVLEQLRADPQTRHLRCIALSADAMPENIQRALAAGFADFWTKPIDVSQFLQRLDELLHGRCTS
ncbi:PAS domain S-box protein [Azohydromonas caseinilytica]|uniref:histidine kinase n=1 Tax=Azohydromonas caseinilytica TaxID=2728836 RepID=A0A848FAE8_9BURK|nr:PAS domain S-box protein [Azohydromonas caseinilytica]NML16514.1 PAS domain S-box protein [Azohydromonas caseinilytica]